MIREANSYFLSADEPRSPSGGVAFSPSAASPARSNQRAAVPPMKRVVSLDSGRHRNRAEGASLPPSARTQSASDVPSRFLSTAPPIMVPLCFDKISEDIAHPLSSLRSCSEFGLNHVQDVVVDDGKSPSKKRPFWKRAWRWVQGKDDAGSTAVDAAKATSAPLSITEKSELVLLGEQYKQQMRMNSVNSRVNSVSSVHRRESRCSVDSLSPLATRTASVSKDSRSFASPGAGRRQSSTTAVSWSDLPPGAGVGSTPKRRTSSTTSSSPAVRLASESRRLSQSGGAGATLQSQQQSVSASSVFMREINSSFWGVMGFQTPKPEPMEFEMTTFKMNGVPVPMPHGVSLGRLVLTRSFSPRSLAVSGPAASSPRSSLSSVRATRSQSSASSVGSADHQAAAVSTSPALPLQMPPSQSPPAHPTSDAEVASIFHKVLCALHQNRAAQKALQWAQGVPPAVLGWTKDLSEHLGEDTFMDAMRMQPMAASIYFRILLFTGVVSAIFNAYPIFISWPSIASLPSGATSILGAVFYVWFGAIQLAHLVQLPLRLGIHLTLLKVPNVQGQEAGDIMRELVMSDAWYYNKFLGWMIDVATIIALLAIELYLFSSAGAPYLPEGPARQLRSAVLSFAGTAVLTLAIRGTVIALFCITAFDPQTLLDARKRGLSKWNVDKLPTLVYSDCNDASTAECPICLCPFERGEMLMCLPCDNRHSFHAECIRDWLLRQNACPLCQKVI